MNPTHRRIDADRRDSRPARGGAHARRGTILIVTLWILVVLTGMVLVLAQSMRVEGACSANYASVRQALAVEQGAIQYVLASVDGLNGEAPSDANTPTSGLVVGNGAFWIIRPNFDSDKQQAYGIVDEASKVNLNTADEDMLTLLPRMTNEDAAAIIDWRDADESVTPGGAESEFYLLMPDAYQCKNAPLETIDELMLVRGMTGELLYGEDTNRNGVLDVNEDDADQSDPPDNRNGKLDRGLYDLATVYSAEAAVASGGSQRVDVNAARTEDLRRVLGKALSGTRLDDVLVDARRERPYQNVLDFFYKTKLTFDEFQLIADSITCGNERILRGRINVLTAPKEVLMCLPGLDESDASALIARRSGQKTKDGIGWVTQVLSQEKAVGIGSSITTRSYQFSADIVSVSGDGRAFRRCRIVVDAREAPPRVIYRRDLTSLGWPLDQQILDELRTGGGLENMMKSTGLEIR